jgi:hypothetical protein
MSAKSNLIISLIALGIVDVIIPIPILGIILIYVVLQKPTWFRDAVRSVYND